MPFYFAWVGDAPIPPFTLQTLGDVWGGSWQTTGSIWGGTLSTSGDAFGTGVFNEKSPKITNLRSDAGLRVGGSYFILSGTGSSGIPVNTSMIYQGNFEGDVTPPIVPGENLSLTITTNSQDLAFDPTLDPALYEVVLDDTSMLEIGEEYGIEGQGLQPGTTFVFDGNPVITISQYATASANGVLLTLTKPSGRLIIKNIDDKTGLVSGETYQVFGIGLDNNVLGTFQDDGTLLLSKEATESALQAFLFIHRGTIYPDGGPFDPIVHAVKDEYLFSIELEHSEGHFPSLKVGIKNPHVGLLSPGRNVWCWLSWHRVITDPITPLFHGRLTAIPSDILDERVTFSFIAEPTDYEQQRNILTESLKVLPYYDPIWFEDGNGTPDTVLEAYTRTWHTDRTTLQVSTSDIAVGEDGTLEVAVGEHLSSDLSIEIADKPTSSVFMTATVSWNQRAAGTVDLSSAIAGSSSIIRSYSGDGLAASWPKPSTSMGGGWTVGLGTEAYVISTVQDLESIIGFTASYGWDANSTFAINTMQTAGYYAVEYPVRSVHATFLADYAVNRAWQEKVSFFIDADIQPMSTDGVVEIFSMNSNLVDQPIDIDGNIPLFDPRSNTFFKTERGQQAFQWLVYYAIAKLTFTARAVAITFTTTFDKVALADHLSCRWNAHVFDPRIPGGEATGKITSYKLLASASGGMRAVVTIGCTVGLGGSPVAAVDGLGTYAEPGYMAPGYQVMTGSTIALPGAELTYQNFDDFPIMDDGINFFDMQPNNVIKRLSIYAGADVQLAAITTIRQSLANPPLPVRDFSDPNTTQQAQPQPGAADALRNAYTKISLEMVPVDGSGFQTQYTISMTNLQLSKTIDLGAST